MLQTEEQLWIREWEVSSELLYYAVICVSSATVPILLILLVLMRAHRTSQYFPYMCAIICANLLLLSTIVFVVVKNSWDFLYDILPGSIVCKLSAFIVNASSCFIHWTWVAMYSQRFLHIFFPLRSRRRLPRNPRNTLAVILISSMILQSWALITITEIREQDSGSEYDRMYCGEHPSSASQIILLMETTTTFFIPFALTVLADISVLVHRTPWRTPFKLISADNLRINHHSSSEHMKIVSKLNLESTEKRRVTAIKRCLISATVTLLLNLPNCLLQVIDEFTSIQNHQQILIRRLYLRADALCYILYLLQFPLVPLNMYFLRQNITRSSKKLKEKISMQHEWSKSFQVEMNEASRNTLIS